MRTGAAAVQKQLSAVKGTAERSAADIEFAGSQEIDYKSFWQGSANF